jgi:hypothetical protein
MVAKIVIGMIFYSLSLWASSHLFFSHKKNIFFCFLGKTAFFLILFALHKMLQQLLLQCLSIFMSRNHCTLQKVSSRWDFLCNWFRGAFALNLNCNRYIAELKMLKKNCDKSESIRHLIIHFGKLQSRCQKIKKFVAKTEKQSRESK